MRLPEDLLRSLENVKGFDRYSFEKVHEGGEQVTSVRMNVKRKSYADSKSLAGNNSEDDLSDPKNPKTNENPSSPFGFHNSRLTIQAKIPWTNSGYYLSQR